MEIRDLVRLLDGTSPPESIFGEWGLKDAARAHQSLTELAAAGLTLDLLAGLCDHLKELLPNIASPDDVMAGMVQVIATARSPLSFAAMLEREKNSCKVLLQAISLGPHIQQMLMEDPEAFDYLLATDGQPATREMLEDLLLGETSSLSEERALTDAFRRLAWRETLRVAYSQVFQRYRVELILEQLTFVREALLAGAFQTALLLVKQQLRRATMARPLVEPTIAVLAIGALGGQASDYLTASEVFCICETTAEEETGRRASLEFGERVMRTMLRLLGSEDKDRAAMAILKDVFPPEAGSAGLVPIDLATGFLDGYGRTWHRQQMVKTRAIAGNRQLGERFVAQLSPWIYRRYLSQADETGILAVKRRLGNTLRNMLGGDEADAPLGWSLAQRWLTLLDETVEFLQLLRGGDQLELHTPSTLTAIGSLEITGIISVTERTSLETGLLVLEELILQGQLGEWSNLDATRSEPAPVNVMNSAWQTRLAEAAKMLANVLTPLLGDGPSGDSAISREGDLLLTPMPSVQDVTDVLSKYRFERPLDAYATLQSLAVEPISFLSTRSCRHHLAQLADRLLLAVSETPDPDFTLDNLLRVSNSLGAKGVLWELFLQHPPSLQLYVRLCAASRYLSEILIRNPGMIDELIDAMQLAHLPTADRLQQELQSLCRGKEDTLPVLRAFKDAQHLKIGVRNLIGKEPLAVAQKALTDVAELCLIHVLNLEYAKLVEKYGEPRQTQEGAPDRPCHFTVLVTGKMGAHEPNYHSDLDILVVYAGDGPTIARNKRGPVTTTQHFFTQLAQRVSKQLSALTSQGRLYAVQSALASRGENHVEAFSLEQLVALFPADGASFVTAAQLLRGRAVGGDAAFGKEVLLNLQKTFQQLELSSQVPAAFRDWRAQLECDASPHNLKRGSGGTLDIEAIALSLPWFGTPASASVSGLSTVETLKTLGENRLGITKQEVQDLVNNYAFLRTVEAGLRLLNLSGRHELPQDATEIAKLALLVKDRDGETLLADVERCKEKNRQYLNRLLPVQQGLLS